MGKKNLKSEEINSKIKKEKVKLYSVGDILDCSWDNDDHMKDS